MGGKGLYGVWGGGGGGQGPPPHSWVSSLGGVSLRVRTGPKIWDSRGLVSMMFSTSLASKMFSTAHRTRC